MNGIHTLPCNVNRLLAGRKAAADFEGIWKILYDFKSNSDFSRGDLDTKNLLGEEIFAQNAIFLPLLDKVRTFFKENPDTEP